MGVKDLLKVLDDAVLPMDIKSFSGCRLAVDASGWLHKAVFATAEDFIMHAFNGRITSERNFDNANSQLFVDVIISKVNMLRCHGIEPVLVFDGRRNTLKSETNIKREEARNLQISDGLRILSKLKQANDPACKAKLKNDCIACFQKGLGVTHAMEKSCISALRQLGVTVFVAPFEADPQLAFLCHIGHCQGVLSEDSDILMYSAACGSSFPILYKYDERNECVKVVDIRKLGLLSDHKASSDNREVRTGGKASKLSLLESNFSCANGTRMFVQMCLLAGCDYCESVPGVGIVTAMQAVIRFLHSSNESRLSDIVSHFRLSEKKVPPSYLQRLKKAEALIYFHPVYDPHSRSIVNFQSSENRGVGSTVPLIDQEELLKLGTAEDLLREFAVFSADNNRSLHMEDSRTSLSVPVPPSVWEFCEGRVSLRDFGPIAPYYPWDLQPSLRQAPPRTAEFAPWFAWTLRRKLMDKLHGTDGPSPSDDPGTKSKPYPSSNQQSHRSPKGKQRTAGRAPGGPVGIGYGKGPEGAISIHKWKDVAACSSSGSIIRAFRCNLFSHSKGRAVAGSAPLPSTSNPRQPVLPSNAVSPLTELPSEGSGSSEGSVCIYLSDDDEEGEDFHRDLRPDGRTHSLKRMRSADTLTQPSSSTSSPSPSPPLTPSPLSFSSFAMVEDLPPSQSQDQGEDPLRGSSLWCPNLLTRARSAAAQAEQLFYLEPPWPSLLPLPADEDSMAVSVSDDELDDTRRGRGGHREAEEVKTNTKMKTDSVMKDSKDDDGEGGGDAALAGTPCPRTDDLELLCSTQTTTDSPSSSCTGESQSLALASAAVLMSPEARACRGIVTPDIPSQGPGTGSLAGDDEDSLLIDLMQNSTDHVTHKRKIIESSTQFEANKARKKLPVKSTSRKATIASKNCSAAASTVSIKTFFKVCSS